MRSPSDPSPPDPQPEGNIPLSIHYRLNDWRLAAAINCGGYSVFGRKDDFIFIAIHSRGYLI